MAPWIQISMLPVGPLISCSFSHLNLNRVVLRKNSLVLGKGGGGLILYLPRLRRQGLQRSETKTGSETHLAKDKTLSGLHKRNPVPDLTSAPPPFPGFLLP
uniref:Uncharacterized protein n=1 Tax=Tetraselmis sp. GSL018 TaxID=582737 RepID=A0A061SEA4_9CHLO